MKYFISMGSNEGPSEEIMGAALHKLSLMPLLSIGKVSSLYKTPPWGKTDQAEFLNAVIEADWQDTPEGLLELLLDTEKAFGRRRMMGAADIGSGFTLWRKCGKTDGIFKITASFFMGAAFCACSFCGNHALFYL